MFCARVMLTGYPLQIADEVCMSAGNVYTVLDKLCSVLV